MSLNLSEIIITAVNFLVLLFFLNKFLFKPYFSLMDKREEKNARAMREQEEANARIEESDRHAGELEAECAKKAAQEAQKLREELSQSEKTELSALEVRADAEREEGQKQLRAEESDAERAIGEKLPELSERLLDSLLGGRKSEEKP